ncbi:MAG: amidohydrolase family protein [Sphingomonadales bacterium]|nr:amidohydrolase family protein [Sphingomonadales bacterium]
MHLLFRSVRITQRGSSHHGKRMDVRVRNGRLEELDEHLELGEAQEIVGHDLWMCPGWVDTCARFREPGHEFKESLRSGSEAAFRGGFTRVLLQPDTHPVLQSRGEVEAIHKLAQGLPVELYVAGALTRDLKGQEITEMFDLHRAGVRMFSQADAPMESARTLGLALQYARQVGCPVQIVPADQDLSRGGLMHEGQVSLRLGLKGIPDLAEHIQVMRDLAVLTYFGGQLHFTKISSAGSLKFIRQAREAGLDVTCGVTAAHLYHCDEDLERFETDYKLWPPLRALGDREQLRMGVLDGSIDVICSDHMPEDEQGKDVEFARAEYGIASLEVVFLLVHSVFQQEKELEKAIDAITSRPARRLGVEQARIERGQEAEFMVFDRGDYTRFDKDLCATRGVNIPYHGQSFAGRIRAVLHKKQTYLP